MLHCKLSETTCRNNEDALVNLLLAPARQLFNGGLTKMLLMQMSVKDAIQTGQQGGLPGNPAKYSRVSKVGHRIPRVDRDDLNV